MIDIRVNLCEITTKVLSIGLEGEQNHVRIVFDASSVLADCPEAIPSLAVKAPSGVIYPKVVSKEGTSVYWIVSASDCAQDGTGNYQLTFINDEEVIKTFVGAFRVYNSLTTNGPAPDPIQQWIDEANEALGTIEGAVERAENAATASETAQGKAEDAQTGAETAQALAEAAEEAAEVAEAGAETAQGKAENAQEAAENARDTAQGYVSDAQGYASDAQGYANDAAGSAETAGDKAQEASGYASDASGYASDAQGYANDASGYADSASGYATQASGYADDASGYATTAGNKATEAGQSATQASQSATTAGNKATEAAGSATSASADALKAEGFAVGQQNGTDVTSGSPYYENNAKYYSEQAEQSAEDAEQTVVEVTNKLNSKAPVVIENASGSIATFSDGADGMPMEVEVAVEPVQDLHGQANPYPPGGGKNLLNAHERNATTNKDITSQVYAENRVTISGTSTGNGDCTVFCDDIKVLSGQDLTISFHGTDTRNSNIFVYLYDGSSYFQYKGISPSNHSITFSIASDVTIKSILLRITSGGTITFDCKIQVEIGSTATPYAPYSNICPISGWTGANVVRTGYYNRAIPTTSYQKGDVIQTKNGLTLTYMGSGKYRITGKSTDNTSFSKVNINSIFTQSTDVSGRKFALNNNYVNSNILLYFYFDNLSDAWRFTPANRIGSYSAMASKAILSFSIEVPNDTDCGNGIDFMPEFYDSDERTDYPISWETSAGTVYGGTLDVTTGTLTVEYGAITFNGAENWAKTGSGNVYYLTTNSTTFPYLYSSRVHAISDAYKFIGVSLGGYTNTLHNGEFLLYYSSSATSSVREIAFRNDMITSNADWKTALSQNPVTVIYELATPVTYQLTPTDIDTLFGINNVWADTGDVSVDYPADTKLYIAKELSATQQLLELIVTANREDAMKATKAYTTGNLLIVNGTLYRATTSIANGATLTVGTNVTATTIANELAALA